MNAVNDAVNHPSQIPPACLGHHLRALAALERLTPELADLSRHFAGKLRAADTAPDPEPEIGPAGAPGDSRSTWRLFDVARVLEDL
jgi:hypothetical protein